MNERIRISPIRLIDENNEQIGVIDTFEAQKMARAAGLDLVEVAPNSAPPVCRIMDYGKWKYQQKKKEAKAKSHAKTSEMKEVRLRPGTGEHDIQIKTDKARQFFQEGHKVQFTILFRGRQMAHRDIGFRMFEGIVEQFSDVAHMEMSPRIQGRRMTMLMAPGLKTKARGQGSAGQPASRTQPTPPPPSQAPQAAPSEAPQPTSQGASSS
ncbi:MAG: translation initiation factor IF-3 [Phycisphaeraceae bacterium]